MERTQWKDTFRNVRRSIVSWFAIVIVTTLGCGVFFGMLFYAQTLGDHGRDFLKETNYEDFGIMAVKGLAPDEIEKLTSADRILDAEGGFFIPESTAEFAGKAEKVTLCSLSERISRPILKEGSMPVRENECALTAAFMARHDLQLGDSFPLRSGSAGIPEGLLKNALFQVSAVIEHGESLCTEYDSYIYLPSAAFDLEKTGGCYTYIRVDADIPESVDALSNRYASELLPIKRELKQRLSEIGEEHDRRLRTETEEKIRSAGLTFEAAAALFPELADEALLSPSTFGILTRSTKEGFLTLKTGISIIFRLAMIFVLIFLAIGAIVISSTLTILIDQSRKLMGTMKAFGFRNRQIMKRYLFYGITAVALGMALSVALAALIQLIIRSVIGELFLVKTTGFAFFPLAFMVLFVLEVLVAAAATVSVTVGKISRVSAVDLMSESTSERSARKTVKNRGGKRLYSRLILRNMKNDLPRVVTSIVIIAGSCMLMGIGITLKGSLDDMMAHSASEIHHYDIEAAPASAHDESLMQSFTSFLAEKGVSFVRVHKATGFYGYKDVEEYAAVISGEEELYPEYIELAGKRRAESYIPTGSDVIVDQKTSERLGIRTGDAITVSGSDFQEHSFTVNGICRHYYPRSIYMGPEAFRSVFGEDTGPDAVLIRLSGIDRDALTAEIEDKFPDFSIVYPDVLPDAFGPLSQVFHVIVYILIVLSVVMAVSVLLNLVNIFVNRRKNELIIMSVNGFPYREQIGYLLKEALVTTLCGLTAGVLLGFVMTDPLVRVIEMEDVMLFRSFNLYAWVFAVAMETFFAVTIYLYAFRHLKDLDITEISR